MIEEEMHIKGDCHTNNIKRFGLGVKESLARSLCLIIRGSIPSDASGMMIVCCAPSMMETKAKINAAYHIAGPDQWHLFKLSHVRHETIEVNNTAPFDISVLPQILR